MSTMCICGSLLPAQRCCDPILHGEQEASTALALMRSRYAAFAKGNVRYLHETYVSEWREENPFEKFNKDFQLVNWQELEIVGVYEGGAQHDTGEVEFVAHYEHRGAALSLHERSTFRKENGFWRYIGATFTS